MSSRSEPTSVRIPEALRERAEFVCSIDGSNISSLLIEGLRLAIDARLSDPDFMNKAQSLNEKLQTYIQTETI